MNFPNDLQEEINLLVEEFENTIEGESDLSLESIEKAFNLLESKKSMGETLSDGEESLIKMIKRDYEEVSEEKELVQEEVEAITDEEAAMIDEMGNEADKDLFGWLPQVNPKIVAVVMFVLSLLFLGFRFGLPLLNSLPSESSAPVEVIEIEVERPLSQQPELTGTVQTILVKGNSFKEKINNQLVLAMFSLGLIGLIYYPMDRGFDFDLEDLPMFLGTLVLFILGVALPIDQWLGVTGETTYLGRMLLISPKIKIDLFLLLLAEILLLYISLSGNRDFTTMSLGNLFLGNILLVAYIDNFDSWYPPAIVVTCWVVGFSFHILELNNQENFKKSVSLAVVGMVVEISLFFYFVTSMNFSSRFMMQNLQLISFMMALTFVSVPVAIIMLIGLKQTWLSSMRGLQDAIETSLFDVLLLIGPFGGQLFLMVLWWNPI